MWVFWCEIRGDFSKAPDEKPGAGRKKYAVRAVVARPRAVSQRQVSLRPPYFRRRGVLVGLPKSGGVEGTICTLRGVTCQGVKLAASASAPKALFYGCGAEQYVVLLALTPLASLAISETRG